MLKAQGLCKQFSGKEIIKDVSLEIEEGTIVGLVGPNGAGKTTSFYILVGLLLSDEGDVFFGDEKITNLPLHKRAQRGVCYLPQNSSIFKKLTVKENILCAMEASSFSHKEREKILNEILEKFSIGRIKDNYGYSLSGGERRRVEIARTLVLKPKYLLLDEPFAGVDPVTIADLKGLIYSLKKDGIGVLITDHNVREALTLCEKVYVISEGSVIAQGGVEKILANEEVKKVYLGEGFKL